MFPVDAHALPVFTAPSQLQYHPQPPLVALRLQEKRPTHALPVTQASPIPRHAKDSQVHSVEEDGEVLVPGVGIPRVASCTLVLLPAHATCTTIQI